MDNPPSQSKLIRLHPAQQRFLKSEALYRAFCGGIGSGKSWAGAYDLIKRAKPGRLYMVVAPTYVMLADATFRSFTALATELGMAGPSDIKHNPPAVHLRNGAEVVFRSADQPDRLYGANLSGVWMDEASLMSQEVYNILIGRLREAGEAGWATATFTPKGFNWCHAVFATGRPNTELIACRTADNPFLPASFYGNVAGQYTSQQRMQELEGQFVAVEGALFKRSWFPVVTAAPELKRVVRAWDLASTPKNEKSSHDPDYTCGLKLGRAADGNWYVLDLRRLRGSPQQVQQAVRAAAEADGPSCEIVMEQEPGSSGVTVVDFFLRLLAGFRFSGVRSTGSKTDRAMPLASQAEGGAVKLVRAQWNEELLSEFEVFPYGRHDDIVDSCSLAFSKMAVAKQFWMRILGVTLNADEQPGRGARYTTPDGVVHEYSAAMGKVISVPSGPPKEHQGIDLTSDGPEWERLGKKPGQR